MAKKPSGRVTPRKGPNRPPAARAVGSSRDMLRTAMSNEQWQVEQSRSVRSGWIWRGFLMLALLAVGVAIIMGANRHGTMAILWGVIATGWFATSMWLWRQHNRYIRGN